MLTLANAESSASILASIATVVALYAIYQQVRENKRDHTEKTLNIINTAINTEDFAQSRKRTVDAMIKCSERSKKLDEAEMALLRKLLNTYELLHLYVKKNLIDEDILSEFWASQWSQDFFRCENFVRSERARMANPKVWEGVENLARKWS